MLGGFPVVFAGLRTGGRNGPCGSVGARHAVLAQVGRAVTEGRQFLGAAAVAPGDAWFLVALAPLGRGFQEQVQFRQGAVVVAEDGLGDAVQLATVRARGR